MIQSLAVTRTVGRFHEIHLTESPGLDANVLVFAASRGLLLLIPSKRLSLRCCRAMLFA